MQVVDEQAYRTGGTKTTIKSQSMDLVAVVTDAPNALVDTYGALAFWHRLEKTQSFQRVEWLANVTLANYDNDGVGKPGTAAWGWALCDGQGSRIDLKGRFIVGMDPNNSDYDTVGKTGGQAQTTLTEAQLPHHSHRMTSVVSYNASNGVTFASGSSGAQAVNQANSPISTTGRGGGGQPIDNRPQFAVLAAHQFVGY